MIRKEVYNLKREVDSFCALIMVQDSPYKALNFRCEALEALDRAGTEFEIGAELKRFLRLKVHAALVTGGFRASKSSATFGNKASRRYRGR